MHKYVNHLRSIGAPPTRAQRFMEMVRFARYILGVDVDSELLGSARVEGAICASTERRRMLVQRDPLTASQ